mmetsp:Transcript_23901/g.35328  ORF Transcript_23901/g.35328 Transcript_23901/m.35328 type:complete len:216 (+) Transcript_23901:75-722(+)
MKLYLALALFAAAEAFSPIPFSARTNTQLYARVDSSELIKEALAASKEFGASSPEARLAWEAVEEVDASDNSAVTAGSLEDCEVNDDPSKDCVEYGEKIEELQKLIKASKPAIAAIEEAAMKVKNIKLPEPAKAEVDPQQSEKLKEAVAYAKKVTEEQGFYNSAAALAWETVEEIASSGNSNALGGKLSSEECLVDAAQEACEALAELEKLIEQN